MMAWRWIGMIVMLAMLATGPALAQDVDAPPVATPAESLADILARQRGEDIQREPRDFDSAAGSAAGITSQLGTRGGPSDAEVWEALRFGTTDVKVSAGGAPARVVMQDGGIWWYEVRNGPLITYGIYLLLGTLGLLLLFYLIRGRIRISHGRAGVKILRFTTIERFGHWLLAGSFLLLAFTGLITLLGRKELIPLMGKDGYALLAGYSKWIHNNVSWAFMLALVMVFLFWVMHNLPSRTDIRWLLQGGGIFGKGHPPAKKFNAGQKLIFWSVILLGGSIAISGLALLFPFELQLFAPTFAKLNALGIPEMIGIAQLPEQLSPQEEMQYAQLWHAIVGFVMMAIILAHIYIGSIGMEGAYEAMGTGEVDLNWAKDHHSIWVDQVQARKEKAPGNAPAAPAE